MKKAALINDLSGFGKCSLTAAIPVISVMGIQACPLPTAVLTAQTGFEKYYCDDFTDRMDYFTEMWKEMNESFDGIYSGYLAGSMQVEKVLSFLGEFKKEGTLYLADPVLGDHGRCFRVFTRELLIGMKELVKRADVTTPNLTELCFLTDVDYGELIGHSQKEDYINRIQELCKRLIERADTKQTVIVTGIIRRRGEKEYIGNLAVSKEETAYLETPYTGRGFSGTGDLFASVVCGAMLNHLSAKQAMEKAAYFLQAAIEDASQKEIPSNHGVQFEKYLYKLWQEER